IHGRRRGPRRGRRPGRNSGSSGGGASALSREKRARRKSPRCGEVTRAGRGQAYTSSIFGRSAARWTSPPSYPWQKCATGRAPRPALVDGAIMLALGGATAALYGGVLHLWWTHDDFFLLRTLLGRRPYWYFVHVSDYHDMPGGLLTPLLSFSLDVDRRLFG